MELEGEKFRNTPKIDGSYHEPVIDLSLLQCVETTEVAVENTMTTYLKVKVTLEDRDDGGLRVHSEDLPGLILSGRDPHAICAAIAPAIKALVEHNKGWKVTSVGPIQPFHEVIRRPSPRDVDMHVKLAEFVVVVDESRVAA